MGLVLAASEAPTPPIAELTVDGKPAEGWAAESLDGFLGQSGRVFRRCLSGNRQGLAWRYLLLAPVDFHQSLVLRSTTRKLPDRLALFYLKPCP
ncbi:MAG: hypothetical protein NTW96_16055 [Planctomycetia bacterium]|nr:hypothetical protein [Planctomycetia bacterium]